MQSVSLSVGDKVQLEIEKLTFGGAGLARVHGAVIFVPLSAPGDKILAKITEAKKTYYFAEILEIQSAGPDRQKPKCEVFGRCGGCDWQHISYPKQAQQKQQIVFEALQKIYADDFEMLPIVKSPAEYRYRNRISLKAFKGQLGYFARKSHDLVAIKDCPLAEEKIAALIPELAKSIKDEKVAEPKNFQLHYESDGKASWRAFEEAHELEFSQVNAGINNQLIETVIEWIAATKPSVVYDFYCGSGNFSFPLVDRLPALEITGIELSGPAISNAQKQTVGKGYSPKKVKFYLADVAAFLKRVPLSADATVLMDPPRNGASEEIMRTLAQSNLRRIFYISCNPSTLARDLKWFFSYAPSSWKLRRAQPFDMFPQTSHLETLVELSI